MFRNGLQKTAHLDVGLMRVFFFTPQTRLNHKINYKSLTMFHIRLFIHKGGNAKPANHDITVNATFLG